MQQASAPWASSTHRSIYWLASNETKYSRYCTWCSLGTCGKEIMVSCDTCWCTWIKSVHCLVHVVSLGFIFSSPHLEVRAPTRIHQEKIHPPTHTPTEPLLPRHPRTQHPQPPIPSILTPAKKKRAKEQKSLYRKPTHPFRPVSLNTMSPESLSCTYAWYPSIRRHSSELA